VYAPCGEYQELLPYLVRRLLENGANSSFVNLILDHSIAPEEVATNPIQKLSEYSSFHNPKIPLPAKIYQPHWQNSVGMEVTQEDELIHLQKTLNQSKNIIWHAASIVNGKPCNGAQEDVFNPANPNNIIATVTAATSAQTAQAVEYAQQAFPAWNAIAVEKRAEYLLTIAELIETHRDYFIQLCIQEAGKTVANAVAEIREAVDFCRYYSYQAKLLLASPYRILDSTIQVEHLGHGVVACISPWNFPLAIFVGQVVATLVAGNTVIAKPAEQTPIIAFKVVQLMHSAGIPANVLQLIIGDGKIGAQLVNDHRIAGVVFTGSTYVAHEIRKTLSKHHRTNARLIAETGGINAMLVDSSALLEQTIKDVMQSAFDSAGQRCSALRVVYVQQDIFDEFTRLLKGAMAELTIGDPAYIQTDIGPIIDQPAKQDLQTYDELISEIGTLIYQCNFPVAEQLNNYFSPSAYQIDSIEQIRKEAFGPILHVISYPAENIQEVINEINRQGYGLTFGVQSRIQTFTKKASKDIRAGNIYINRNMIGATVGIQPFGGERLSGTGPKAGGPHYLLALSKEKRSGQNFIKNKPAAITAVVKDYEETKQSQIESAINSAEKIGHEFNFMQNELRIEYLDYINKQLIKHRNEIVHLLSSTSSLDEHQTNAEIINAISIINEYKKALINNIKQTIFKIGPTGQRNELRLYNRGPLLYINYSHSSLVSLVCVLVVNIVVGNPILITSNKQTIQTNNFLYKQLIHKELQEKYYFKFLINNQTTLKKLLINPSLHGFIFLVNSEKLTEIENIVAHRDGSIVPCIDLQDWQTTGGILANPKNLYLICTERTITTNTTAMGGNTSLYSLGG
jgi:RHH-type proline utilization regulon transcriptional repressor/proline dehydrogenase/delta 1-pyrroline-5-carboxylate dehydrogenase